MFRNFNKSVDIVPILGLIAIIMAIIIYMKGMIFFNYKKLFRNE